MYSSHQNMENEALCNFCFKGFIARRVFDEIVFLQNSENGLHWWY